LATAIHPTTTLPDGGDFGFRIVSGVLDPDRHEPPSIGEALPERRFCGALKRVYQNL